jgi:hypothetical protein
MKVTIGKYPKKGNRRKINVEVNTFDTWGLDHTLATIIYPALIQLKQTKQGIPSEFVDVGGEEYSTQQSFDFYIESHDEAWAEGAKRWDETLDKMIWAFYQIAYEDYNDKYHHGKSDYDWVETTKLYPNPVTGVPEPTFQMVDKDPNSHWFDGDGLELHEKRIQEGLDLFAKYFRSLWD